MPTNTALFQIQLHCVLSNIIVLHCITYNNCIVSKTVALYFIEYNCIVLYQNSGIAFYQIQ